MKKERNYQPVLVVLVLIVIGVAAWNLFTDWQDRQAETARQQENKEWRQQAEALSKKVAELETERKTVQEEKAPEGKATEVFGPAATAPASPEKAADAASTDRQILAFFNYLDGRDYVKAYALDGGTYAQYTAAVAELSASLPKVAGETESLYTTLKNVSHFFRVLGKKRTELAAEILKNEQGILEPAMRVFYQWATGPAGTLQGKPSLPVMYEYASFFLNTLGGRSYLMRRDSKVRLLTTYYCIRVLDRANDNGMNPNGIDIRPLLASTTNDIHSQKGLIYQKSYLAELLRLAGKYPM
ncbi:MAG: hypothetical protein E4H48_01730 [Syntrophobacterales bacterium]|nr:MAG: hypothetical protein E4H48_01730 [Syntrophobacterales bacterium]